MKIGMTCAAYGCGQHFRDYGSRLAPLMRQHEARHKPSEYPPAENEEPGCYIAWSGDEICLSDCGDCPDCRRKAATS